VIMCRELTGLALKTAEVETYLQCVHGSACTERWGTLSGRLWRCLGTRIQA